MAQKTSDFTIEQLREMFNLPQDVFIEGCNVIAENLESVEYLKAVSAVKAFPVFNFGTQLSKLLITDETIFDNPLRIFDKSYCNEELLISTGFGKTQAKNYITGLHETYKTGIPFGSIVKTFCITGAGKTVIEQFVRFYYNMNYSTSGLTKDVWEQLVDLVPQINAKIDELKTYGFEVFSGIEEVAIPDDAIKVILTGSPRDYGWKTKDMFIAEKKKYVEVKKMEDAQLLITDDLSSKSSKMAKANKLGVKIISYDQA